MEGTTEELVSPSASPPPQEESLLTSVEVEGYDVGGPTLPSTPGTTHPGINWDYYCRRPPLRSPSPSSPPPPPPLRSPSPSPPPRPHSPSPPRPRSPSPDLWDYGAAPTPEPYHPSPEAEADPAFEIEYEVAEDEQVSVEEELAIPIYLTAANFRKIHVSVQANHSIRQLARFFRLKNRLRANVSLQVAYKGRVLHDWAVRVGQLGMSEGEKLRFRIQWVGAVITR